MIDDGTLTLEQTAEEIPVCLVRKCFDKKSKKLFLAIKKETLLKAITTVLSAVGCKKLVGRAPPSEMEYLLRRAVDPSTAEEEDY